LICSAQPINRLICSHIMYVYRVIIKSFKLGFLVVYIQPTPLSYIFLFFFSFLCFWHLHAMGVGQNASDANDQRCWSTYLLLTVNGDDMSVNFLVKGC
jgi:hypothetical protein